MAKKRYQDPKQQRGFDGNDHDSIVARTPSKKVRLNISEETSVWRAKEAACFALAVTGADRRAVVTPAASRQRDEVEDGSNQERSFDSARRELFPSPDSRKPAFVTPVRLDQDSPAKRKLIFGRLVNEITVRDSVRRTYRIIGKLTGSLGGNASHGPIYGELTMGSMQKMVNLMKEHTGLDSTSRFIDVGSGIGKPNLHVAQDPGVEFSYGIEVDEDRWLLGISCLRAVLDAAALEQHQLQQMPRDDTSVMTRDASTKLGHRCFFEHGDIRDARTFDPFTHVYMFSIG